MIIAYTKENSASKNIAEELEKIDSKIKLTEFDGSVLDVPTDVETDCILVLSSHKSIKHRKMLTVHIPGNWGKADYGGQDKTLNIAHAELMKKLIIEMDRKNKNFGLNWEIFFEADHHGPTCNVPIIFIEIGCTEEEWGNKTAGKITANSIVNALENKEKYETVFCVGGGHYSRKFTRLALESEYAPGHILPKYSIEKIDENLFGQAIEKNVGKIKKIFLDKDCNKEQKEKIMELNKQYSLEIIKI